MDNYINYKLNGEFRFATDISTYIVQTIGETDSIPESTIPQAALVLGNGEGMKVMLRLPGGEWTEG